MEKKYWVSALLMKIFTKFVRVAWGAEMTEESSVSSPSLVYCFLTQQKEHY